MNATGAAPPKIRHGREILEYFSSATQIGLTATPKETKYVSNIAYFGEPIYSYSLKQGIRDGFLAPYKVVKVHIDRDVQGYRPEKGQLDREGEEVEDRIYNVKDFDRTLVIDGRTKLVAQKVSRFLKESGDRFQKAIVFLRRSGTRRAHASGAGKRERRSRGRQQPLCHAHHRQRCRGAERTRQLHRPGIQVPCPGHHVTPALHRRRRAEPAGLIVLDRAVGSMTEFKQIVGRGTRVHEDTRKYYFTLIDFRGATGHFADPEFDGEPVQIYEPGDDDPIDPPEVPPVDDDGGNTSRRP